MIDKYYMQLLSLAYMLHSRLKEVLEKRGINITHLYEISGVVCSTLHMLYKDEIDNFNKYTLEKLRKALKCSGWDLIEDRLED